ncbi:MAG: hypothetical protein A3K11_02115 [Nitrospirae bacterium RIFCSPLOWO2_12_FULL_63_8]|nr:MAG: hypothetical protein A3K11_02115 [Nitrospirae bacterium RIFCSPLOWO2_12_FULL_63_8]
MNQAPEETGRSVGPAGWLGVVLVVAAASLFIVFSPRYSQESLQKKNQLGSVAAAYTLAALWHRAPVDREAFESALAGHSDFSAAARMLGLQAQPIRVTLSAILGARHPILLLLREAPDVVVTRELLEGRPRKAGARYVVLAEIRGDEAVILDPGVGPFTLPVPDLVESVGDVGTMWVSNP